MQRPQTALPHQTLDSVLTARLTELAKIRQHSKGTIDAMAGGKGEADESKKPRVFLSAVGYRVIEPMVTAGAGHAE